MQRVAMSRKIPGVAVFLLLVLAVAVKGIADAAPKASAGSRESGSAGTEKAEGAGGAASNRITREGMEVEFTVHPVESRGKDGTELFEGDDAEIRFRITDAAAGRPVRGLYPAAWVDMGAAWKQKRPEGMTCKDRVGVYLAGTVGLRPMIDLNSYFVLVMNKDNTISVIDPLVGITGITKLYALIHLKKPGADWVRTGDDKRLFVTMPLAGQVAVIDTGVFKVTGTVDAGSRPVRIVMQRDGKYLWVGNDAEKEAESGVTVIDVETLSVAARIRTGRGHHEIALSAEDRFAFVSNRREGTVSVIDVRQLKKIRDVKTGPLPISVSYSPLSRALYVADGEEGVISVVDGERHEAVARIKTKPGLGPMRFTEDGRWGMAVNTREDVVYVIDASTNRISHTLPVGARPYQVAFSRAFAYVRSLGSERVAMINLAELEQGRVPPIVTFPAGEKAPEKEADIGIADAIVPAPGEAAVLVVSPADYTVYYYMEGMNTPMGNFRNYGRKPAAVGIVDRALREIEPGVYAGKVKLDAAGTYDVAFLLDAPSVLHCFSMVARPNPSPKSKKAAPKVEYLTKDRKIEAGGTLNLRLRLIDRETGEPRTGLPDVAVLYYLAPGRQRSKVPAQEVEDGIYEAAMPFSRPGAYYVYVESPAANLRHSDTPFITVLAVREKADPGEGGKAQGK